MGSAALTDLVPGAGLGKAFSRMYSFMGIAIIGMFAPCLALRLPPHPSGGVPNDGNRGSRLQF